VEVLDGETSPELKAAFKQKHVSVRTVPTNAHNANRAERSMQSTKNVSISVFNGCDPRFPTAEWDRLLPAIRFIIGVTTPSTGNPKISAWEARYGPVNWDNVVMAPPGTFCQALIAPEVRPSWGDHTKDCFFLHPRFDSHRSFTFYSPSTNREFSSNAVEFFLHDIASPGMTVGEELKQAIVELTVAVDRAVRNPAATADQSMALRTLRPKMSEVLKELQYSLSPKLKDLEDKSIVARPALVDGDNSTRPPNLQIQRVLTVEPVEENHDDFDAGADAPELNDSEEDEDSDSDPESISSDEEEEQLPPISSKGARALVSVRRPAVDSLQLLTARAKPQIFKGGQTLQASRLPPPGLDFVPLIKPFSEINWFADVDSIHYLKKYEEVNEGLLSTNACFARKLPERFFIPKPVDTKLKLAKSCPKPINSMYAINSFASIASAADISVTRATSLEKSCRAVNSITSTEFFSGERETEEMKYHAVMHGKKKDRWMAADDREADRLVEEHKTIEFVNWKTKPKDAGVSYFRNVVSEKPVDNEILERVRWCLGGNLIKTAGGLNKSSPTASDAQVAILANAIVSTPGAQPCVGDLADFFLQEVLPVEERCYAMKKLSQFSERTIVKYGLRELANAKGEVLILVKGCMYGHPRAGYLGYRKLDKILNSYGYKAETMTPCIYSNASGTVRFCTIVDDFKAMYTSKLDMDHLWSSLRKHYGVKVDFSHKLVYNGVTYDYDLKNRVVDCSIPGFAANLLKSFDLEDVKLRSTPAAAIAVKYGRDSQTLDIIEPSAKLDETEKKTCQQMVGSLLYYGNKLDRTLLLAIVEAACSKILWAMGSCSLCLSYNFLKSPFTLS